MMMAIMSRNLLQVSHECIGDWKRWTEDKSKEITFSACLSGIWKQMKQCLYLYLNIKTQIIRMLDWNNKGPSR